MLLMGGLGLLSILCVSRRRWWQRFHWLAHSMRWILIFVLLLLLTAFTRYSHIQNLVLPVWVDSVHHTMVTSVLLEQGTLPDTYTPYLDKGRFFYHWGFHALLAFMGWMQGAEPGIDIARQLLLVGQLFNTLTILMVYALGRILFGSSRAGLWAALFAALVSWFPAYYVSWGRYPQLGGMLVLPAYAIILLKIVATRKDISSTSPKESRPIPYWLRTLGTSQAQWPILIGAIVLLSGLLLIHIRVTFFAITFTLTLALWALARKRWQLLPQFAYIGVGSCLLCFPWLLRLINNARLQEMMSKSNVSGNQWWSQYNAIPWDLVWVQGHPPLFAIVTGGISVFWRWGDSEPWLQIFGSLWAVFLVGSSMWMLSGQGTKPRKILFLTQLVVFPVLLLFIWAAITGLLINSGEFGLPAFRFIHNASAVISLYLPLSLGAGALAAWSTGLLSRRADVAVLVTTILIPIIGIIGAFDMQTVVNRSTVLVDFRDVAAMQWIQQEIPDDARFAVNASRWQRNTYRGTDGGYWLTTLTGRDTILPPALYSLALPSAERDAVNAILDEWTAIREPNHQAVVVQLQKMGVTHIYNGFHGGHMDNLRLDQNPFLKSIYRDGPVAIYLLSPRPR